MPAMRQLAHDLRQRMLAVQGHYLESRWMPSSLDESALLRSWDRCTSAGLRPQHRVEFDPVGRARMSELDDRYGGFARTARPEMDRLLQSFNQSDYAVLLASPEGVLIDALGHPDNQSLRLKSLARRGVDIGERRVGTTAPSVAAAEWHPQLVHADAHWCEDNRVFFCVAAPIEGPQGEHVAVIDVTGAQRVPQFDALALVREAAVAIENLLFRAESGEVLVRFHHRAELLGTPAEAIVTVDASGRVRAANRAALRYLNRMRPELAVAGFEALFGRRLAPLLSRDGLPRRIELHLATGPVVQAVVEGPPRGSAATPAQALFESAGAEADLTLEGALEQSRRAGAVLLERALAGVLEAPVRAHFDAAAWDLLAARAAPAQLDALRGCAAALRRSGARPPFGGEAVESAWQAAGFALAPPLQGASAAASAPPTRLRDLEADHMRAVLARCGGNVSRAARELGVSRNTLYRRLGSGAP